MRLEDSTRAGWGTRSRKSQRAAIRRLSDRLGLGLRVAERETKFGGRTIDIVVYGLSRETLMPVKSRTTQGGGHGQLYVRDVRDAPMSAQPGKVILPPIVAKSWPDEELSNGDAVWLSVSPSDPELSVALDEEFGKQELLFRALNGRSSSRGWSVVGSGPMVSGVPREHRSDWGRRQAAYIVADAHLLVPKLRTLSPAR
jgi:hypothetical protein